MARDKDFITITNKMIYDKLVDIEKKVNITNGKVKLNRWMSTTAIAILLILIGKLAIGG